MATRQRLRAVLGVRKESRPCWRCALNLSRYNSTSAASTAESSESMNRVLPEKMVYDKMRVFYDNLIEQDIDDKLETVKPDTQSSSAEVATTRSDESKGHSSQTVHEHSSGAEGPPLVRHVLSIPPVVRSIVTKDPPGYDKIRIRTSFPRILVHETKDSHKPSRYRIRRIRRIRVAKDRPPKFTASVLGKVGPRKISVQLKHDSLTPLIHTHKSDHSVPSAIEHPLKMKPLILRKAFARVKHESLAPLIRLHIRKDPLSPAMEYQVGSSAPFMRKVFSKLMHGNLAPLIRTYNSDRSLPPAPEHPPRITALARRKIFAHFNHNTLAPLIRKYVLDHLPSAKERPPGKTLLVPRKVFAQLVCDNLAPIIRTQTSENSFLLPQSESVEFVGKPRIRIEKDGRRVALPIQSQSEWTQAAHKPNALEEVKVRKVISITKEPPRDASDVTSEARGEDEPSSDELASWLDELQALVSENIVSDTPDVTTKTGFSLSSPHSSPQYPARPPASSWNPTSTRQSLEYPKMSFSTWSSKAAERYHATAANRTLETAPPVDPPSTETNLAGFAKGRPEGIREALRLWQEQHESTLADTSTQHIYSTLKDSQNLHNQSGEDDSYTTIVRDDEMEDDEEISMDPEEQNPDIFAPQVFFRRGDLVQLTTAMQPVLAIFVRNVAEQCQFYTMRGQWVNRTSSGITWGFSRFVDPDDLNEILPYLPAEKVAEEKMDRLHPVDVQAPRDAGAKVIEQMSLFQRATEAVFRQHAERINRLYEIIAPPEGSTNRIHMSLKDIAMKVLRKQQSELTPPMMYAIHIAIGQRQNIMWDSLNYRQNPTFEISPRQGLKYIDQVRDWVREYQEEISRMTTNEPMSSSDLASNESTISLNPISTFVQKARVAIQQSRHTRPLSKSGFIGPSSIRVDIKSNGGIPCKEIKMQEFDFNEKIVIHYLDVWATSSSVNPYTNLASLGPMILRAVGMYEGLELDRSKGFTLLQELGVITPWENRTVYKLRRLNLPGHDDGSGEASRMLGNAFIETRNFEPKDSMEDLRKDWGDMPVFCVDSALTLERDDGVSLELVENDPSLHWVHIHVANPSAFIGPDSATAKFAASLSESIYFPERKYPMLNPKVTRDQLGLANDRPCITFSAKISADGDVLEKKVTPGIVRNVHFHTPQSVGQALGLTGANEERELVSILTVGGRMPSEPVDGLEQTSEAVSDPEHIKILRKLLELGEAVRQKRVQAGAPGFYQSSRIVRAYPAVYVGKWHSTKFSRVENQHIRQFEGDPIISLQRTTELYGLVAKMISDLMTIAGDVGASWCAERNIPIPYRGILRNLEPASSPEDFKREVLDPKVAKYGYPDKNDLRRYMGLVGIAQVSDRPLEHFTLGLPAYCKATSPLRRHADMYAHWQMEAAIRYEAATGTSLIGSTDDSYLPFSRAQVEEYAAGAMHRERRIHQAKLASMRHWLCQALFRARHFNEATLPETFEVTARPDKRTVRGTNTGWCDLLDLSVSMCHSAAVAKEGGLRVGDVWETRLGDVDPYYLIVYMDPVRLVTREEPGG